MGNPDVFITGGRRTPIGAYRGCLAGLSAGDLAGAALRPLAAGFEGEDPAVVLGSAVGRGNLGRYAALAAGLPPSTPAWTVNAQCTSGLTAVRLAAEHLVATGRRYAFAGGAESCSQADVMLGARTSAGAERVAHAPAPFGDPDMGPAADTTAAHLGISREEQDDWARTSYQRAAAEREAGRFAALIALVDVEGVPVTADELPTRLPAAGRLRRYPPAFGPGGRVTAGNAAPFADAAAILALSTRPAGVPLARVVAWGTAAADPAMPALAVIPAVERALAATGLSAAEIDRWEINEAFAVKVVAAARHFDIDPARLDVNGGAIACGHPFGASGAIILLHLVDELRRSGRRYGVAAIAGAGGLGEAVVVERA
ncbi:MAG: thiolase family protein [Dehalococcoidia bacterium]|nr:thiolase family protein [Dehalococcoidia bacterium]